MWILYGYLHPLKLNLKKPQNNHIWFLNRLWNFWKPYKNHSEVSVEILTFFQWNGVKPGRKMAGEFSFYRACIKPWTAGHHDVGSGMEDLSREKMACKQLDEETCPSVAFEHSEPRSDKHKFKIKWSCSLSLWGVHRRASLSYNSMETPSAIEESQVFE